VVSLVALGLIVRIYPPLEVVGNIAINLISSAIGIGIGYVLVPRNSRTIVNLDVQEFCNDMARADSSIEIVDIWLLRLLDGGNHTLFRQGLREACHRNIDIRIVLTKPESAAARERANALSETREVRNRNADGIQIWMHNHAVVMLQYIDEMTRETTMNNPDATKARIEFRFCEENSIIAMYRVDQKIRWNFYPPDRTAFHGKQYVFSAAPDEGEAMLFARLFEMHWNKGQPYDLKKYQAETASKRLSDRTANSSPS